MLKFWTIQPDRVLVADRGVEVESACGRHADERGRVADADRRDVDFDVLEGGEARGDLDIQEALRRVKTGVILSKIDLGQLGELRRDPADLRLQDGADLGLDLLLRSRKALLDGRLHRAAMRSMFPVNASLSKSWIAVVICSLIGFSSSLTRLSNGAGMPAVTARAWRRSAFRCSRKGSQSGSGAGRSARP